MDLVVENHHLKKMEMEMVTEMEMGMGMAVTVAMVAMVPVATEVVMAVAETAEVVSESSR